MARARLSTGVRVAASAVAAALSLAGCANAQPGPCLPLTPAGTQGGALLPGGVMNVRFAGSTSNPLALDVYPQGDATIRPLAVVLRGGAGTVGQRSSYVGQLVELFGEAGYIVATPDYRSATAAMASDDLRAALRMLTMCHAAALHIDPYKVVLVAEDSAAPTALRVAARLLELRLGRFAGAPPAPAAVVVAGGRFSRDVSASVPTVVVHGGSDTEVPLAAARDVCAGAKAPCTVVDVPGASHRVENWWPSQWSYKASVLEAVGSHVGAIPASSRLPGIGAGLRKRIVYDPVHQLTLDAWVPSGTTPRAAVVLVHGGGWEAGDRVTYVAPMFALAAARGLAWVSVDYRLTPEVTNREQIADVASALTWLRAQAGALRIDPSRLVLVGESASGQIVTQLAARERGLAGVLSFYGVYDLEAMAGDAANPRSIARRLFRLTTLDEAGRAQLRAYSPVRHAARDLPPLLLVAGTGDRLIEQQRAYAAALRAAGARVEAIELDGAPHGMESWNDQPAWRVWEEQVGNWLTARLR